MLQNIHRLCPIAYIYAYNCYSAQARLFVIGGKELSSKEGTTQGDPPSMAYYGLGQLPMMFKISESTTNEASKAKHIDYVDDLPGAGKLRGLRCWFD